MSATGPTGPSGAGALVLLEQHTASNSASLNFTSCISATYDDYMIEIVGIRPVTNNVSLLMRASTNGGSSYDASAIYSFGLVGVNVGSGQSYRQNGTGQTSIVLGQQIANASTAYISGTLRLQHPGSSSLWKSIVGTVQQIVGSNGSPRAVTAAGNYGSATPVNAFQFFMSGGNIASGTIRIYGIAKT